MLNRSKQLALAGLVLFPFATFADSLTVVIQGIAESKGSVRLVVLDSEEAYKDDGQPVVATVLPAMTPSVTYTAALPSGQYAVRLMHDVNGNERLDKNIVGMPKEPYGFSNNATASFGPPKWKAAAFQVNGDTTITIDLVH